MSDLIQPSPAGWLSFIELMAQLGVSDRDLRSALSRIVVRDMHWGGRKASRGQWAVTNTFPPSIVAILREYLAGELSEFEARKRLDDDPPASRLAPPAGPDFIPEPEPPPEVLEETLTVVSYPREWPNGQISHFGNPHLIRCQRADGTQVAVRVAHSGTYTPRARDGKPLTLRARFCGNPRTWSAIDRPPRYLGAR